VCQGFRIQTKQASRGLGDSQGTAAPPRGHITATTSGAVRCRRRAISHRPELAAKAARAAEIVKHGLGDKIVVFKFKRRKNYSKKQGHRQGFTEVRINDITLG
jgi:hypothetical protein